MTGQPALQAQRGAGLNDHLPPVPYVRAGAWRPPPPTRTRCGASWNGPLGRRSGGSARPDGPPSAASGARSRSHRSPLPLVVSRAMGTTCRMAPAAAYSSANRAGAGTATWHSHPSCRQLADHTDKGVLRAPAVAYGLHGEDALGASGGQCRTAPVPVTGRHRPVHGAVAHCTAGRVSRRRGRAVHRSPPGRSSPVRLAPRRGRSPSPGAGRSCSPCPGRCSITVGWT